MIPVGARWNYALEPLIHSAVRDEDDGHVFAEGLYLANVALHAPGLRQYALRNEYVSSERCPRVSTSLARFDVLLLSGLSIDFAQHVDGNHRQFGDEAARNGTRVRSDQT